MKVRSLRENISYVSQNPVMFEGTVADNIRYGRPDASVEEIENAAKLAQAHEFILGMSEGYATEVGELGSNLSGGQRQRLSIARAILRDAPILLLDEATSALDQRTEEKVRQAIQELSQDKTTIMVAHRLSTVTHADHIYVLDDGSVVEEGTHADLMASEGLYAAMFTAQRNSYG